MLCIDIGNTSIKLARVGSAGVGRVRVIPSGAGPRELSRALGRAAGGENRAAIASVRPASTATVRRLLERECGMDTLLVTHRLRFPVEVATRRPERVGIDRLCAACGAVGSRGRHAIVVDAGTAITVDLVLDRRFVGGLILAGPQMMLSALHRFTAQLPELTLPAVDTGSFDDTVPAMQTGATVGSAGAIRAAVRHLQTHAGRPVRVWLTGGHARRLQPVLPEGWKFLPYLTLQGLFVIARHSGLEPGD